MIRKPVAACVTAALLTVSLFLLFVPDTIVGRNRRELALQEQCRRNLDALADVCRRFALIHNGYFSGTERADDKEVANLLKSHGLLKDTSVVLCPSTRTRFPRMSFHFIPGVRQGMSPKMPCVIEKLTNHNRLIGVIYVDGTTEQIRHECQNYIDLLPLFSGRITPSEKKLLETHLKRLDIP